MKAIDRAGTDEVKFDNNLTTCDIVKNFVLSVVLHARWWTSQGPSLPKFITVSQVFKRSSHSWTTYTLLCHSTLLIFLIKNYTTNAITHEKLLKFKEFLCGSSHEVCPLLIWKYCLRCPLPAGKMDPPDYAWMKFMLNKHEFGHMESTFSI